MSAKLTSSNDENNNKEKGNKMNFEFIEESDIENHFRKSRSRSDES